MSTRHRGFDSPNSERPAVSESKCPVCRSAGRFAFAGSDLMFGGTRSFDYLQCVDCGAVYQAPTPSPEEIAGFYPGDYSLHRPAGSERRPGRLKRAVLKYRYGYGSLQLPAACGLLAPLFARLGLRGAIPFRLGGELLDIGCGNGKFLLGMTGLGWKATGVELSGAAVAVCRESGLDVVQGDLFAAAFESARFDVATARHLIEHLPEPQAFVREVSRILKPGGLFLIETPNSRALGRSWFKTNWFANEVPRHLVLFHPANLRRLIEGHGLALVSDQQVTSPKIILNSWDYFSGNTGRPSRRRKLRRLLARPYVYLAQALGRGDLILQVYEKR